jgi:hypothetical protein
MLYQDRANYTRLGFSVFLSKMILKLNGDGNLYVIRFIQIKKLRMCKIYSSFIYCFPLKENKCLWVDKKIGGCGLAHTAG